VVGGAAGLGGQVWPGLLSQMSTNKSSGMGLRRKKSIKNMKTLKPKKWEGEFDRGCNADNISDPPSDKRWIKDFISNLIQQERKEAHEEGFVLGANLNIPVKARLDEVRNSEREKMRKAVEGMMPPIKETKNFNDAMMDSYGKALQDLLKKLK